MIAFFLRCLQPHAIEMLFISAICICGFVYPAWPVKPSSIIVMLLFLVIAVLAFIAFLLLVSG